MDFKNPPHPLIPPISSSVSENTTFSLFSRKIEQKWSLRPHFQRMGRTMGGLWEHMSARTSIWPFTQMVIKFDQKVKVFWFCLTI